MAYSVGRCLLRTQLKTANMSQQQLADRMGVKHQQINKYYNDKQVMSYGVARKIAHILECRMEELYE